jgi:hypothetical protein
MSAFTVKDAYELFSWIPGDVDDPPFFKEFLSTFQNNPEASKTVPFVIRVSIPQKLPSYPGEDVPNMDCKSELTIPMGALNRYQSDPIFQRKLGTHAINSFLNTLQNNQGMMKCVNCKKPSTVKTKNVKSGFSIPMALQLHVTECYFICDSPVCRAKAAKAREGKASNTGARMCGACRKFEPPGALSLMKCARCKVVFYCDADCQKKHWKEHRPMCKAASKTS